MTLYRTIVADPPWQYVAGHITTRANKVGTTPAAASRYAILSNAEVAALPVSTLAEPDAHLYLWVTVPLLFGGRAGGPSPIEIAEGWGFRYVTMLTWHKLGNLGMGFHFRGDTEHVIFAVRGKLPIPSGLRVSNHFAARKTGHSAKPDRFYEIVERVSPEPRLELFARRRRFGWDAWGYEAPTEQASQAPMGLLA